MLNLKSNMLENNYSSQTQTQTLLFKGKNMHRLTAKVNNFVETS